MRVSVFDPSPTTNASLSRILWRAGRPVVLAVGVTVAVFLLYWRTAAPSVLPGDAGELQFAAWGFWLAHPTGYPLYLILGGIWQHLLPFGDPAYRLNLFSAFWTALAVGLAFLVFWNVTRARGAALIAALTFAVSPLVWSQATRAEVYALNTFFVALLTLLGLIWRAQPQRRYAAAFAFAFGLSLAHHRTTILLLPAFAALFADRLVEFRTDLPLLFKRAALYAALAAIPLLFYLYVPLRAGATPYAALDLPPAPPIRIFENSPRGWLGMILGSGFANQLQLGSAMLDALRDAPITLVTQFNLIGALLGVGGFFALLARRSFPVAAFVLFGAAAFLLFNGAYRIGDIADYYTPVYFFFCLALAAGVAFVVTWMRAHSFSRGSTLPGLALLAIFALVPLQNFFNNFAAVNQRQRVETRQRWENLLAMHIPENAILVTNDRDEMTPLYYLQRVEGRRPDLTGLFPKIAPGAEYANVVALVERAAASGRPIYAIKPLPALALPFRVAETELGLWHVNLAPLTAPEFSSDAVLGDALRVRGFSLPGGEPFAGDTFTLGVQYVPLSPLRRDYKMSAQLFDDAGEKIAQGNDHIPGEGEYPPSQWRVGRAMQDQFEIELGSELEAGEYRIMLGAYDPVDGEMLGELTEIGRITIHE